MPNILAQFAFGSNYGRLSGDYCITFKNIMYIYVWMSSPLLVLKQTKQQLHQIKQMELSF